LSIQADREPSSHPDACMLPSERPLEAVIRRYRPDDAVLEELVEVLYQLLTDGPRSQSATPQSHLLSNGPRVRNVS
jgi:hypothetical protein